MILTNLSKKETTNGAAAFFPHSIGGKEVDGFKSGLTANNNQKGILSGMQNG